MKNKKIIELANSLQECNDIKGVKIAYAIVKNKKILNNEIEVFNDSHKLLLEKYSEKDDEGKSIIVNNQYKITDIKIFNEEYSKLLDIDVDINLHKIKQSDLPEDITVKQMDILIEFLSE